MLSKLIAILNFTKYNKGQALGQSQLLNFERL